MWQYKVQTPFPKMHAQIKENVTQPKALSIILILILYF
jgi:hypothetical protein